MPVFSILNSWIQPQKPIHEQMYFRKSLSAWHQQPWWVSEKSRLLWIFDFLPLSKICLTTTVSIIQHIIMLEFYIMLCTFTICLMRLLVLWISLENFWIFFRGIFLVELLWRIFLGGFLLGGFFLEDFLGGFFGRVLVRNSLFTLEFTCLSRFWFLSRFCLNERKEEFRSLEVRLQVHRT